MKRFVKAIRKYADSVPHLFAKCIVLYCILFFSAVTTYALWGTFRTGIQVTDVVAIAAGVFGGELVVLCLRTVLSEKKKNNNNNRDC